MLKRHAINFLRRAHGLTTSQAATLQSRAALSYLVNAESKGQDWGNAWTQPRGADRSLACLPRCCDPRAVNEFMPQHEAGRSVAAVGLAFAAAASTAAHAAQAEEVSSLACLTMRMFRNSYCKTV